MQEFIVERVKFEKKSSLARNREFVIEQRLTKLKEDAQQKLMLIEDFKRTLDEMEWSEQSKEDECEMRMQVHAEFLENLKQEKIFKQEIYAAEKLMEHESRMVDRKKDKDLAHMKLLSEQEELLHNIELMQ